MKANRKFILGEEGYSQMVPIVLAVIIAFAIIFIGAYVNGVVHDELLDALDQTWAAGDADTKAVANMSERRMDNIAGNWDSSLDIVQVVIIISLLAMALGAIFLFTKYR